MKVELDPRETVWRVAYPVDGYDSKVWGKDINGNWIKYDDYENKYSEYGWRIMRMNNRHVPISVGELI